MKGYASSVINSFRIYLVSLSFRWDRKASTPIIALSLDRLFAGESEEKVVVVKGEVEEYKENVRAVVKGGAAGFGFQLEAVD
ncbi:hypothetical protein HanHA300_Chr15g0585491 [Helianthus annuus]|nr:hypothetical protein HanHA300_Chr15g0585491 [Helianthus annuus]KAJ0474928.1 hypothetical protein HanHA89_Chr15g0635291 [Helianthus annuus]KAJ0650483.1 hypothetical protein HanLR1_Chr15g0596211 [Helianthus annuus]KAJ0654236.1 hypothetical protein HanOQP8_Chr15g0592631 [Helianthus annuus]